MKVVKFSRNWNSKLGGDYFTTIRKPSSYYKIGDKYQVVVEGQPMGYAELERLFSQVHFVHEGVLNPLGWAILSLDTGYAGESALKLFESFGVDIQKDGWYLLCFRWLDG